jgi:hypothetical protein
LRAPRESKIENYYPSSQRFHPAATDGASGIKAEFVFTNRLTVKFQVQEIVRAERIAGEAQVHEVKRELARLTSLGSHRWLEVGGARARGTMEAGREGQSVSA